ncbi:MAG: T9SS type A sorting domain-containing protein [candidate division Zixibacteria bacterium]|nr:T9SS type A sorting domain-containing protein [candidate division Zixibacteria bacterium]
MRQLFLLVCVILIGAVPVQGAWTGTTADRQISYDDNNYAQSAKIVIGPDGISHVFWHEENPDNDDVHYGRSANGGDNWISENADFVINIPDGNPVEPQGIDNCIDEDGNLYVVWSEKALNANEIWLTKSTDAGLSWSGIGDTIIVSSFATLTEDANNPAIAADRNGTLHCVWNQVEDSGGVSEIFYSRSTDRGESWDEERFITLPGGNAATYPDIACDVFGTAYVIWKQSTGPDTTQVRILISRDGGDNWEIEDGRPISYPMNLVLNPEMAIDPVGNLHVIWQGSTNLISPYHYEIYYTGSDNNGISWNGKNSSRRISYRQVFGNSALYPELTCDRYGNVFVVWNEEQIDLNNEIHLTVSTDMGNSWSGDDQDEIISFPDGEDGYRPFPAADANGNIHVVWTEFNGSTPDNYEVYYSRGDSYGFSRFAQLALYPIDSPIIVPQGRRFNYSIAVVNNTNITGTATGWLGLGLPGGGVIDSLLAANIQLDGGVAVAFDSLGLNIPGYAPEGMYTLYAKLGFYPDIVIAEDSFKFTVVDDGVEDNSGQWTITGFDEHINTSGIIPADNSIEVNAYPNPFNARATINYDLPVDSDVRIDVYDLMGRRVSTLIDEYQQAGRHELSWDATDHSTGIYFYRVSAGDLSVTKRITLIK